MEFSDLRSHSEQGIKRGTGMSSGLKIAAGGMTGFVGLMGFLEFTPWGQEIVGDIMEVFQPEMFTDNYVGNDNPVVEYVSNPILENNYRS